jgi:uncharacterized membrane protein YbjE (DUF340 family)
MVLEVFAVDVRVLKDPVAQLAVRVLEEWVGALGAALQAVVNEAGVAVAHGVGAYLLALAVTVASLGATSVGALAAKRALTGHWVESVPLPALAAVWACVRELALALPGALDAALCALPVAEAARGAHFKVRANPLDIEVRASERAEGTELQPVAPAKSQATTVELEENRAGVGS